MLDGHSSINSIPEEDFFLRTNIGSVNNQLKLRAIMKSGRVEDAVTFFLDQNNNDYWSKVVKKEAGDHKTGFEVFDYDKFYSGLKELASTKLTKLRLIYQNYINCVLDAVSNKELLDQNYKWKLYFTANADFLIYPPQGTAQILYETA